jgi:hypothetical protein
MGWGSSSTTVLGEPGEPNDSNFTRTIRRVLLRRAIREQLACSDPAILTAGFGT